MPRGNLNTTPDGSDLDLVRFFALPLALAATICYEPGSLRRSKAFRGSSVVEHPTVNRTVVGSNPTHGANDLRVFLEFVGNKFGNDSA